MATEEGTAGPVPWREVFRGARGRLTTGLLLLEALVAISQLVIATIMPDVRRDLGMLQLYGLAFTAPSLATIASIPIAGRSVDRYGPARVLPPVLLLYAGGLVVAATAPTMPVLLVGQFLSGAGGGGLYALSLGTIAKTYPDRLRPRVLALLASMWILPGLIAPPFAALIASTIGWRYAFVAPLPVIVVAWLLIAPSLHLVPAGDHEVARLRARWPMQLMVGAAIVFTSLTAASVWTLVAVAVGLAVAVPALRRIVPPGTFRAAPGIPATAVAAFLLSFGFLAVDAFATLMLTRVRGLSLGFASVAITTATVTWAVGAAWQSGRAERVPLSRLLRIGVSFVLVGQMLEFATLFTQVPVAAGFVGWGLLGIGMGISFSTVPLAAMRASPLGDEGTQVSSVLLLDMLGVATGAGVGGGIVAIAHQRGYDLAVGIAGSFVVGIAGIVALLVLAGRLPSGRAPAGVEGRSAAG